MYLIATDNEVEVVNLIGIDEDSSAWKSEVNVPRSSIQPGNLVEMLVSFRIAPFARSVQKVQCHLHRVFKYLRRLDEQAAAMKSMHDTEGEQLQKPQLGKRNLPAPFGRVNRACMEVDELSHDVEKLGVAK
ncbi:hypothetical protein B0H14DRAFT_2588046 [Mycena olivaceomarginata]|nr:hypothetical protein B0H14DRAFT_2588046 [Mycena olivaceomarginata]